MSTPVVASAADNTSGDSLFLGIDAGTSGFKAAAVGGSPLRVVWRSSGTAPLAPATVVRHGGDGSAEISVVGATAALAAALDAVPAAIRQRTVAVSGAAHQHCTLLLRQPPPAGLLGEEEAAAAAAATAAFEWAHVWMDSSTAAECAALEAAAGGAAALASTTGSRAYPRFSGSQLRKRATADPQRWERVAHVALASSYYASLLLGSGRLAPIDAADGSGMNLLDVSRRTWRPELLAASGGLAARHMGDGCEPLVSAAVVLGPIEAGIAARFGLRSGCLAISWTGDNPASAAGLCLAPGEVAISLGTSDTLFGRLLPGAAKAALAAATTAAAGHLLCDPLGTDRDDDGGSLLAMLCFRNGSQARQHQRDHYAGGSWAAFEEALANTPPGNGGQLAVYLYQPEITPQLARPLVARRAAGGHVVAALDSPAAEIRALLESQVLSMRLHCERLGLLGGAAAAAGGTGIKVTGGGSASAALLQVIANVFDRPVLVCCDDDPNAAAVGAALRALHAHTNHGGGELAADPSWDGFLQRHSEFAASRFRVAARPNLPEHQKNVYADMQLRLAALVRQEAAPPVEGGPAPLD